MALLSSGRRTTVEGLPNVQSSSTTQQWQSYLACWMAIAHAVATEFKAFSFLVNSKLFCYSVIPLFRYSVFRILQRSHVAACVQTVDT